MSRWVAHAVGWGLLAVGGGLFYVVLEQSPWKGLGLAVGTTLIDVGVLFLHEDLRRARRSIRQS